MAFLIILLVLAAPPAFAQDERTSHVRPECGPQHPVDQAARRSPAIREGIDRLESRGVTIDIRAKAFAQSHSRGRAALRSFAESHRDLVIEPACQRSERSQMTMLGHELFHAIEIAEEPWIVNPGMVADRYSRTAIQTDESRGLRTFETDAAAAAGDRVRRPLLTNTTRHGHGA